MSIRNKTYYANKAELVLKEGEQAVEAIKSAAAERDNLMKKLVEKGFDQMSSNAIKHLTDHMDEQGKKAMGCWSQAQAYAAMSQVADY